MSVYQPVILASAQYEQMEGETKNEAVLHVQALIIWH